MTRAKRSDPELQDGAKTIRYEFAQLLDSAALGLNAEAESVNDEPLMNAALESSLIHVRKLFVFFSSSGSSDDVMAREYLEKDLHVSLPVVGSPASRNRLNKRLAHPSYRRQKLPREWPVGRMVQEFHSAMDAFLGQLDQEHPHRRAWFGDTSYRVRQFRADEIASDLTSTSCTGTVAAQSRSLDLEKAKRRRPDGAAGRHFATILARLGEEPLGRCAV